MGLLLLLLCVYADYYFVCIFIFNVVGSKGVPFLDCVC